jgi:hypothetical protein
MLGVIVIVVVFMLGFDRAVGCYTDLRTHPAAIPVQDRAKFAPLVLHTLAVYTNPTNVSEINDRTTTYSAHFWLIKVYKGAFEMAGYFQIDNADDVTVYNIHDR